MSGLVIPNPASQAALDAVAATVPTKAQSLPPPVKDGSEMGDIARYAMENHTHASKVRRTLAAIASNVGTYTWNFAVPFGTGVVPICSAIAQTASGITDLINVQIDGASTNTGVVFRITRYSQSFLSLLGINILGFNSASIPITLHMVALEP